MSDISQYPFKQRLRYKVDNYMSRGSSSIFMALLLTFLIGFMIFYAVARILDITHWDQVAGSRSNCYVSKQVYGH